VGSEASSSIGENYSDFSLYTIQISYWSDLKSRMDGMRWGLGCGVSRGNSKMIIRWPRLTRLVVSVMG